VGSADAVTLIRRKVKLPAADAKLPQLPADISGIDPQVYQGAQGHIAGNSGKTFKVQGLQLKLLIPNQGNYGGDGKGAAIGFLFFQRITYTRDLNSYILADSRLRVGRVYYSTTPAKRYYFKNLTYAILM
jgi:hypothetical protein